MKQEKLIVFFLLFIIVYLVPLKCSSIDDLGSFSSNVYYSGEYENSSSRVFYSSPVNRDGYNQYSCIRIPINSLNEVPKYLIACVISQEDRNYYNNFLGINLKGIARMMTPGKTGGGSGIYQQTAKNLFYKSDKKEVTDFNRKLSEFLLSLTFGLNPKNSKDDVLKAYLNNINFGNIGDNVMYGVKIASQYHFNKDVSKLTLSQCALLSQYINKPYIEVDKKRLKKLLEKNKLKNLKESVQKYVDGEITEYQYKIKVSKYRREKLLKQVLKQGYINEDEYSEAINEKIVLFDNPKTIDEDDKLKTEKGFVQQAEKELNYILDSLDLDIKDRNNLKIYTTLNRKLQNSMQSVFNKINSNWGVNNKKTFIRNGNFITNNLQNAAIVFDRNSSAVLGMIDNRVDFALQNKNYENYCFTEKPAGSIFKIFDYYTFFANHPEFDYNALTPDYEYFDNVYYPKNQHAKNRDITIREAVSFSSNWVPFNLYYFNLIPLKDIKIETRAFGIKIKNENDPKLLLGQDNVSLFNITQVYQTVANNGIYRKPYYITKIIDKEGNIIYSKENNTALQMLDETSCYNLKVCFNGVINNGGTAYFISSNPNINAGDINYGGKTGTTNNSANLWYIGYNPEFTLGIWKGFSNTNNIKAGNAGSDCALIWNDIISDYYKIALK